jgi:hypothetical protein
MSSTRPPGAPSPVKADWQTYHHDNARTGVAGQLVSFGALSRAWQTSLDGAGMVSR